MLSRPIVVAEREGNDGGYIVAFIFTKSARQEIARARRQKGFDIVLVKVEDIVRVGDLIDSADREGRANAEIAGELHMSVATGKAHVSRILDKLGVDNRVAHRAAGAGRRVLISASI